MHKKPEFRKILRLSACNLAEAKPLSYRKKVAKVTSLRGIYSGH